MNSEKQLQEILETLQKIEKTLNPPLNKKIINWILNHFFEILIFAVLCYLSLQMYEVYISIKAQGIELVEGMNYLKDSTKTIFDDFKFWK